MRHRTVVAWSATALALAIGASNPFFFPARLLADQDPRGGATGAPGAAAQAAAQNTAASILGQVVDGATGQPIADAIVTVGVRQVAIQQGAARAGAPAASGVVIPPPPPPPPPPPGGRGAAGPQPLRLLTGADGRFVIRDLPAGPVGLQASAPGYLAGNAGQVRPRGLARPIRVNPGDRTLEAVVRLWKVGVITGQVSDEAGEPAIGVNVQAFRRSDPGTASPAYLPSGSARTDDRGIYRLATLPPGDYIIAVRQLHSTVPTAMTDTMMQSLLGGVPAGAGSVLEMMSSSGLEALSGAGVRVGDFTYTSTTAGPMPDPARPSLAYQTTFYPGVTAAARARAVNVQSGQERSGVDLQLALVPAVRVSGSVSGPTGPVASTSVRLLAASPDVVSGLDDGDVATAVTGPDGAFMMMGVAPGQYIVRVERQGRSGLSGAAANNPLMQLFAGGASAGAPTTPLYGQVTLAVGQNDVPGVSLALGEGAHVSGRVVFDGDGAPAGEQLKGWGVTLAVASGTSSVSAATNRAAVDERGQFASAGYGAGRYWISANVQGGGAQWLPRMVTAGGRDVLGAPLDLGSGDVDDVVITMTNKLAQVTGTVRVDPGTVARTATVVLIPATYRPGQLTATSRRPRQVAASEQGVYTIGGLVPGDYLVVAVADEDASDMADEAYLAAITRVATRVTLADLDRKAIDLQVVRMPR